MQSQVRNTKIITKDSMIFLLRSVEQCHYTYITKYRPSQEEICDENYEKVCQISYATKAVNDTIKKCYTPVVKGGGLTVPIITMILFSFSCNDTLKDGLRPCQLG